MLNQPREVPRERERLRERETEGEREYQGKREKVLFPALLTTRHSLSSSLSLSPSSSLSFCSPFRTLFTSSLSRFFCCSPLSLLSLSRCIANLFMKILTNKSTFGTVVPYEPYSSKGVRKGLPSSCLRLSLSLSLDLMYQHRCLPLCLTFSSSIVHTRTTVSLIVSSPSMSTVHSLVNIIIKSQRGGKGFESRIIIIVQSI